MAEHTPTPWSLCGEGKCSCLTISSPDYPIAKVTAGKWGDDYPAMRQAGTSLENKYEAYMEQITYGEIDPDLARENARFIVNAVNNHEALVNALQGIAEFCSTDASKLGAIDRLASIRNTALNVLRHVGQQR